MWSEHVVWFGLVWSVWTAVDRLHGNHASTLTGGERNGSAFSKLETLLEFLRGLFSPRRSCAETCGSLLLLLVKYHTGVDVLPSTTQVHSSACDGFYRVQHYVRIYITTILNLQLKSEQGGAEQQGQNPRSLRPDTRQAILSPSAT